MGIQCVTVFGGSGFIGRSLVQRLAGAGVQVRVAVRDPEQAMPLKPLGDVGQVVPVQANLRHAGSVQAAVKGADAVVNLVGILFERGAQRFLTVHHEGARVVAAAAAEAGVQSLVHLSAIGASKQSQSLYAWSKAAGEEAVQDAFPGACIVRPSVVFGPGDGFFNLFASLGQFSPMLPLIGGGQTRFQPVFVGDVAHVVAKLALDPGRAGTICELGGPNIYTFKELMQLLLRETGYRRLLVPVPFPAAYVLASFMEMLPAPPLTRDQVTLLKSDNIVSGTTPGLRDFGIEPTSAELVLPSYMDIYRKGGRYSASQPV